MKWLDEYRLVDFWETTGYAAQCFIDWPLRLPDVGEDEAATMRRGIARYVRRIMWCADEIVSWRLIAARADLDGELAYFDQAAFQVFVDALGDARLPIGDYLRDSRQPGVCEKVVECMQHVIDTGRQFLDAKPATTTGRVKFKPPSFDDDADAPAVEVPPPPPPLV